MFCQVIVWDCDVSFLRFLWWEDDDWAHEMWELQIGVYHFRAVSSPTCTNSALWKTAEDNQRSFPPSVINTVKNYFYVDDCLKSLPSDAIQHAYSLRVLLSRGFLKITAWISNSRNFLETIPELERSEDINNIDARKYEWPVQRGFRVQWSPYKVCILSAASSTSDPSGFLAFFVLTAKEILQDLCRMKLGWDDEIPDEYRSRWELVSESFRALKFYGKSLFEVSGFWLSQIKSTSSLLGCFWGCLRLSVLPSLGQR